MYEIDGNTFLATLPPGERRMGSFAASFIGQTIAFAALALISIAAPQVVQKSYQHVELVAPDLTPPQQTQIPIARPKIQPAPVMTVTLRPATKAPELPPPPTVEFKPTVLPKPEVVAKVNLPAAPAPKFDSPVVNQAAGPKVERAVRTDNFAGSSAAATLQKPAHLVQTGGFGDPNGVAASDKGSNRPNIAAVGSFDLPAGAGQGNGSGGTRGAKGTVASAGFGNGVASEGGAGGRGNSGQGRVQLAGFQQTAAPAQAPMRATAAVEIPKTTPVAIESKPQPVYSAEARALKIEGEVLVKVVFTADGQVKVVNVVRGLGHGLDEAAIRAAQGIQFKPAVRDGRAVDSAATLHIVFALS